MALCDQINRHNGGCECRHKERPPCMAMIDEARMLCAEIGFTAKEVEAIFDPALAGKAQVGSKTKRELVTALSSYATKVRAAEVPAPVLT